MLAVTADARKLPKENLPRRLFVQCHQMGWMTTELMIDWHSVVWSRRLGSAILVLNAFTGHLTEQWLVAGDCALTPTGGEKPFCKPDCEWIPTLWSRVSAESITKRFKKRFHVLLGLSGRSNHRPLNFRLQRSKLQRLLLADRFSSPLIASWPLPSLPLLPLCDTMIIFSLLNDIVQVLNQFASRLNTPRHNHEQQSIARLVFSAQAMHSEFLHEAAFGWVLNTRLFSMDELLSYNNLQEELIEECIKLRHYMSTIRNAPMYGTEMLTLGKRICICLEREERKILRTTWGTKKQGKYWNHRSRQELYESVEPVLSVIQKRRLRFRRHLVMNKNRLTKKIWNVTYLTGNSLMKEVRETWKAIGIIDKNL
ncbi:hypothetical protein PR048_013276 [Dryococelus australis]|uniref:DDE-1 domain-containing protein n=1 Tax=Dryococelus australis TaxID=614101 RepID=A0ABQ9HSK1_9NEOP|nr:hypothetical protein PR048_013276 [Dryococelus australis]